MIISNLIKIIILKKSGKLIKSFFILKNLLQLIENFVDYLEDDDLHRDFPFLLVNRSEIACNSFV